MTPFPAYIALIFGITTLVTVCWFFLASRSKTFLLVAVCWTLLQAVLGYAGVYEDAMTIPPRIMVLGVLPAILMIVVAFNTRKGRMFIDGVSLKTLTAMHTIRIAVEVVLALLYHQGAVSRYMTFEGTNFDILSGLTALPVAVLAFRAHKLNRKMLLVWNVVCLLLLLNVVITALFAVPTPFQLISMNQPNVAVLYFPFHLLPTVVVPLVLFAHLIVIRKLRRI
ncbi:MAG: hypothetical protein H6585_01560 [Flavobacteriales bacterium]|nr:hypothetical protein [Flavobacteriales bacterium]MCB9447015.1 hypothetical protein [Flavobacteriales bacterium]